MPAQSAEQTPSARGAVRPPARCHADDWGMSPGVNRGILGLCGTGVVGCVSLFGNGAHTGAGL
jgi:hypothetical protein